MMNLLVTEPESGRGMPLMRAMTERTRVLVLILIMTMGLLLVTGLTIGILYKAAFNEENVHAGRDRREPGAVDRGDRAVRRYPQHRFIRGDQRCSHSAADHGRTHGSTRVSGRPASSPLRGGRGISSFSCSNTATREVGRPEPVPFDSVLAEPMRRALSGQSGTVVGLDYRGATVLAAYEPVDVLDMGIVAKIDLEEVQAPFWKAGLLAAGFSLLVVIGGAALLVRVSNPMLTELQDRSRRLEETVTALGDSEERFRATFELAGVGIAHVSLDGRFVRVNPRLCEITRLHGRGNQEARVPGDHPPGGPR